MKSMRFDTETIQAIFDKHSLGPVKTVHYSVSGIVNPCMFINDRYVVRINARDPELPKFQREQHALKLLRETEIPVPEVLAFDNSMDILPYEILITHKIEGKELGSHINTLSRAERESLAYEAGVILAKIHGVHFDRFGDFKSETFGEHATWHQFLVDGIQKRAARCMELALLKPSEVEKIVDAFTGYRHLFNEIKTASLIHNDYNFGNMLYDNGRICGILDFEWAVSGDPEFDFKILHDQDVFADAPDSETPFLAGYTSIRNFEPNFEIKKRFYQLFLLVELIPVSKLHWGEDSYRGIKSEAFALLERMESL